MLPAKIEKSIQPKQTIRIDDKVIITNPEFVTRVGYPISFIQACKIVQEKWDPLIGNMLGITGLYRDEPDRMIGGMKLSVHTPWPPDGRYKKPYEKIIAGLAGMLLEKEGFGGRERKIYTKTYEEFQGKIYQVVDKKVVKTGIYFPPWSEQSYEGEWDGGPGGLDKEETHVLLFLSHWISTKLDSHEPPYDTYLVIDRCNVKLAPKDIDYVEQILPAGRKHAL